MNRTTTLSFGIIAINLTAAALHAFGHDAVSRGIVLDAANTHQAKAPASAAPVADARPELDIAPAAFSQAAQPHDTAAAPPAESAGGTSTSTPAATPAAPPAAADTPAPAKLDFGAAGSRWWSIGAGVAHNFDKATDANAFVSYSYFLDDNVEFNAELGFWYSSQPGKDAGAVNPNMVFRWHFINTGTWTVYADAGIGLLFSTDNIPQDGTSFNFTPRAGIGFTRLLTDDGTRLQVGLRWHHVSNARIEGEKNNPGRDSAMLYAGVIFPF